MRSPHDTRKREKISKLVHRSNAQWRFDACGMEKMVFERRSSPLLKVRTGLWIPKKSFANVELGEVKSCGVRLGWVESCWLGLGFVKLNLVGSLIWVMSDQAELY